MIKLFLLLHLLTIWGAYRWEKWQDGKQYPVSWNMWSSIAAMKHPGRWNQTYLEAIAILESGWGMSPIAQEKHNLHGISLGSGTFKTFDSGYNSFVEAARLLNRSRLYSDCKTLEDVRKKWCPSDKDWAKNVRAIYKQIGGK